MSQRARTGRRRKADTIAKLEAINADAWVATASPTGRAHLIPLSYAWREEAVVLAVPAGSLTARNIRSSGRARLGFGPTRDMVIIDSDLDGRFNVRDEAAQGVAQSYADQADWDPRLEPEPYVFLLMRPYRVQAWRERNELPGKVLMLDGRWLY